jgi:hypothetical protein
MPIKKKTRAKQAPSSGNPEQKAPFSALKIHTTDKAKEVSNLPPNHNNNDHGTPTSVAKPPDSKAFNDEPNSACMLPVHTSSSNPKPFPLMRPGFHGASLLAAFHQEYPPESIDLTDDYKEEDAAEDDADVEEEATKASTNRARLTMHHAITALCHLITLTDTDGHTRFLYSLNPSLLCPLSPSPTTSPTPSVPVLVPAPAPSFELTVLKGSIKTHVWSMAARYDDDYLLEVHNLPPPALYHYTYTSPTVSSFQQQEKSHSDDVSGGSSGSVGVNASDNGKDSVSGVDGAGFIASSDDIGPSGADLLWTMNGFDMHTSRVGLGVVSWPNMHALHHYLCTKTVPHVAASLGGIGVATFTRLFSRVVLGLPMREALGEYFKPMPATLM